MNTTLGNYSTYRWETEIWTCPKCTGRLVLDRSTYLLSNPPKCCGKCDDCGWKGYVQMWEQYIEAPVQNRERFPLYKIIWRLPFVALMYVGMAIIYVCGFMMEGPKEANRVWKELKQL